MGWGIREQFAAIVGGRRSEDTEQPAAATQTGTPHPPAQLYECPDCGTVYISVEMKSCRSCGTSVTRVQTERDLEFTSGS